MQKIFKKIIIYSTLLFFVFVIALFAINYFIFGTPYSTEYNCKKIKIGDSLLTVLWQMGIPSYYNSSSDIKILGYPIPMVSYINNPVNKITLKDNKVLDKKCVFER